MFHEMWNFTLALLVMLVTNITFQSIPWYFMAYQYASRCLEMQMATIHLAALPPHPRCRNPRYSKPRQYTSPENFA